MDKQWHHARIPLSSFSEQGSWDDGSRYSPEGRFDWTTINALEIVAEQGSMVGMDIWFDNIYVSNQDTSQIWESKLVGLFPVDNHKSDNIIIFPNPMGNELTINYQPKENTGLEINLFNFVWPTYQNPL